LQVVCEQLNRSKWKHGFLPGTQVTGLACGPPGRPSTAAIGIGRGLDDLVCGDTLPTGHWGARTAAFFIGVRNKRNTVATAAAVHATPAGGCMARKQPTAEDKKDTLGRSWRQISSSHKRGDLVTNFWPANRLGRQHWVMVGDTYPGARDAILLCDLLLPRWRSSTRKERGKAIEPLQHRAYFRAGESAPEERNEFRRRDDWPALKYERSDRGRQRFWRRF